jgi:DNA-binding transcriptional LysR family regulator
MDLRGLRYFVAVARERNFTRAAIKLRVAQPALSQQIRALERELGLTLIERSNRTSGLTDAGESLLARAERILAEVRDATDEMADYAGSRRGVVRIGCALQTLMESILPPLFVEFQSRYPDVRVVLKELHTEQVLKLLRRGEVDLGLVHLGRLENGRPLGTKAASPDLALVQLRRERLVLIVGPRHGLAGRNKVGFAALREEPFVAYRPGSTVRLLVAGAARQHGFRPRIAFSTSNLGTVRALVSAGLGVAAVPQGALDLPGPPVHGIAIESPRIERIITLARNKARYEGPAMAAVRRALSDAIRQET